MQSTDYHFVYLAVFGLMIANEHWLNLSCYKKDLKLFIFKLYSQT